MRAARLSACVLFMLTWCTEIYKCVSVVCSCLTEPDTNNLCVFLNQMLVVDIKGNCLLRNYGRCDPSVKMAFFCSGISAVSDPHSRLLPWNQLSFNNIYNLQTGNICPCSSLHPSPRPSVPASAAVSQRVHTSPSQSDPAHLLTLVLSPSNSAVY